MGDGQQQTHLQSYDKRQTTSGFGCCLCWGQAPANSIIHGWKPPSSLSGTKSVQALRSAEAPVGMVTLRSHRERTSVEAAPLSLVEGVAMSRTLARYIWRHNCIAAGVGDGVGQSMCSGGGGEGGRWREVEGK
jgi:hypothetical protein